MRRFLVPLALLALVVPACRGLSVTAAAVVDGRKIDDDRVRRQLRFILTDPRLAEQLPGDAGAQERQELARQFLTFLVHQSLMAEYAQARRVAVGTSEINERLEAEFIGTEGEAAFQSRLETAGATVEDVRNLIGQQLLRQRVIQAVAQERLSDARLMQEYESRLREFTVVQVAHILVNGADQAQSLSERATTGNFGSLARRFSRDPGSAQRGGDLGRVRAVDLVDAVAEVAMEASVGAVVGPVESDVGFHVVWVKQRETAPFEVVRPQLLQELQGPIFSEWLLDRVGEAEIRVNPRYGAFDPETGEVVPSRSASPEPEPVQLTP